jgi:tRNA-Thr(GGU) m(6)t(6)A37 methyltransferase TsaA
MNEIKYRPIGTIYTPFDELEGMPIQPSGAEGVQGKIELLEEFAEGLKDLDGFSHIILLYHLHGSRGFQLRVVPFLDRVKRGLFSTRAPKRPNPIGLSMVRLVRIEGKMLHIENIDVLNGTPLLDIKPYVPEFDSPVSFRLGWLEAVRTKTSERRADKRFT